MTFQRQDPAKQITAVSQEILVGAPIISWEKVAFCRPNTQNICANVSLFSVLVARFGNPAASTMIKRLEGTMCRIEQLQTKQTEY
ncbi:hypothetical protein Plhal304r1_c011g0041971 [Plasmopara halstedii]